MDKKTEDQIIRIAKGNPGALNVSMRLHAALGKRVLDMLEQQGITGGNVWLLYKDVCGEQIEMVFDALQDGTAVQKVRDTGESTL